MHFHHVMDFVLFHINSSSKWTCVFFFAAASAAIVVTTLVLCVAQIFPCTQASNPRTFLANFQFEFASNNLFRSVWWKLQLCNNNPVPNGFILFVCDIFCLRPFVKVVFFLWQLATIVICNYGPIALLSAISWFLQTLAFKSRSVMWLKMKL